MMMMMMMMTINKLSDSTTKRLLHVLVLGRVMAISSVLCIPGGYCMVYRLQDGY